MRHRILGAILIVTAITTLAYWTNYFTGGDVQVINDRWYTAFEDAFPAADCWMALTSFFAGIGLWRGNASGARFGLLAGSALLFLAGMDITFDVENGLYAHLATSDAMKFELLINIWSLALGLWAIAACWNNTATAQPAR